jgi:hypothetical protein
MKMTPWFPPEIRPVHVGDYRSWPFGFRHFNGKLWSIEYHSDESKFIKDQVRTVVSRYQEIQWRGLAEEPK